MNRRILAVAVLFVVLIATPALAQLIGLNSGSSLSATTGVLQTIPQVFVGGVQFGAGGLALTTHASGTGTCNPSAIATITSATCAITVAGASFPIVNPTVICSPQTSAVSAGGFTVQSVVTAANTVTITLGNPSAGSVTPTSATWRCDVWQH